MYCVECSAQMISAVPPGDRLIRSICPSCAHVEYAGPKVLVSCILFRDDRILWIKRATAPYQGLWGSPSGFVEPGETVEEAASRELQEETLLVVPPEDFSIYAITSVIPVNEIYVSLIAALPSMDFGLTPEISDIRLALETEMLASEYAYPAGVQLWIKKTYEHIRAPNPFGQQAKLRHLR